MNDVVKCPNPQGKGLVPVLDSLAQARKGLSVPAKDIGRIADELFTSLFILNSQIKFKPVAGQTYWLYRKDSGYRLSLIAPEQWSPSQSGQFIGACELHFDLTWTLRLSDQGQADPELIAEIARRRERFDRKLAQAECVDAMLPFYLEELPFYARVLASALAYSIGQSMQKGGLKGLDFRQAQKKLPPPREPDGHDRSIS
ncbi:MAG: DUF2452 domain-containing protein [Gammaproteobacteria bacterium]